MQMLQMGKIEINRLQEAYEQESRIKNKERQIPRRLSQVMLRVKAGATKIVPPCPPGGNQSTKKARLDSRGNPGGRSRRARQVKQLPQPA
jgi:hypothetical protein